MRPAKNLILSGKSWKIENGTVHIKCVTES